MKQLIQSQICNLQKVSSLKRVTKQFLQVHLHNLEHGITTHYEIYQQDLSKQSESQFSHICWFYPFIWQLRFQTLCVFQRFSFWSTFNVSKTSLMQVQKPVFSGLVYFTMRMRRFRRLKSFWNKLEQENSTFYIQLDYDRLPSFEITHSDML